MIIFLLDLCWGILIPKSDLFLARKIILLLFTVDFDR